MFSKKFLDKGFVFLGVGIASFGNILTEIILNYFNIDIPQYNIYICLIVGILLIIIGLIMYYKESKENHILSIIGLDNMNYITKIKNPLTINIIDDCKNIKKSNSKSIISSYVKNIKEKISNYISYKISYFGVAPLPFIAIAGKYYRKVNIVNHYEYHQKDDKILPLKTKKIFLNEKLKCEQKNNNSKVAVITIETTTRINDEDLKQFRNANIIRFYLEDARTNAIAYEKQLEEYSETIADTIYKISKTDIEKIYILGACQSSLVFEVFRRLNDNRIKEIIVCNYKAKSKNKYNWGISIYNENDNEKYVELGSDICG